MWQGVWQELLNHRVVYRVAEKFHATLGLDTVDLPAGLTFGKFLRKTRPRIEGLKPLQETTASQGEKVKMPQESATRIIPLDEGAHVGRAMEAEEPIAEMVCRGSATDVQKKELPKFCNQFDAEALAFLQGEEGFLWATQLAAEAFAQGQQ